MNYKDIFEEIFEVYNVNASEFADKIQVQRSSISHIMSGRNKPSLDFLLKIKEEFAELRWDYLLLGEKPMTKSEESTIQKSIQSKDNQSIKEEKMSTPTLFDETIKTKNTLLNNKENVSKIIEKIVWFYTDGTFKSFDAEL